MCSSCTSGIELYQTLRAGFPVIILTTCKHFLTHNRSSRHGLTKGDDGIRRDGGLSEDLLDSAIGSV